MSFVQRVARSSVTGRFLKMAKAVKHPRRTIVQMIRHTGKH